MVEVDMASYKGLTERTRDSHLHKGPFVCTVSFGLAHFQLRPVGDNAAVITMDPTTSGGSAALRHGGCGFALVLFGKGQLAQRRHRRYG